MGGIEILPLGAVLSTAPANLQVKPDVMVAPVTNVHDWPSEMQGPLVWDASTFASEVDYTLELSPADVSEVRSALRHFNSLGLYGSGVSVETFPLPTLGPKLRREAAELYLRRGFVVIRGLDANPLTHEDNVIIFLGITAYMGDARGRQNEDGDIFAHIRDAKLSFTEQRNRPTRYSSRASTFHTDAFCDVLALQTRNSAARGGRTLLASSWMVYNRLVARHPEVAELLAQPIWPFDSRGKMFPSSTRPLLYHHAGRILLNFSREPLLGLSGVPRPANLPSLTTAQRAALDVLEAVATESQITLPTARPGDLLLVHNHSVLHSREAFEDAHMSGASMTKPRYLVRMWLKNSALAWALPRALQRGNERIYSENEIGERWNVMDRPRLRFDLSERLTS